MYITTQSLAIAATLLLFGASARAQPNYEWLRRDALLADGHQIRIQTDAAGEYTVYSGTQQLTDAEVTLSCDSLRVTDSEGRVLLDLGCTADGRIIMPPGATLTVAPQPKKRSVIGIKLVNLSDALAAQLGLEPTSGTVVSEVTEGYPAEQAGLRKHDVILRADGQPLDDSTTLKSILAGKQAGEDVVLTVIRGGRRQEVSIPVRQEVVKGAYFSGMPGLPYLLYSNTGNLYADTAGASLGQPWFGGEVDGAGQVPWLFSGEWTTTPPELFGRRKGQSKQQDGQLDLGDVNRRLDRLEQLLEKLVDEK